MNEEFDPPFLSEVRFGTFLLVLMPLAFLFAGIVALHLGVFYNTEADQLWAMNSRRAPDATSPVPLDDSTYVSIERDRCHGWCPAYTLTLYGSGRVEFDGEGYVCAYGKHGSSADPREVRRLVDAMLAIGFMGYRWEPGVLILDYPSVETSLAHQGRTWRIHHDHGDQEAPRWLADMEDEIDRVAGTSQWLPFEADGKLRQCRAPDGTLEPARWGAEP